MQRHRKTFYDCLTQRANLQFLFGAGSAAAMYGRCIYNSEHATEFSEYISESSEYATESSEHVTEFSEHITESSEYATEFSKYITEFSEHVTQVVSYITNHLSSFIHNRDNRSFLKHIKS
jgi:hypothetical protein